MTYNDMLLFYAKRGAFQIFRQSAFRKFVRRNIGKKIVATCQSGFKMNTVIGDSVDDHIAIYGLFEKGTTHVIENLSQACSSFIDIGCNIGYYSCLFGVMNRGQPLLAIDPNPAMIERTRENLQLNKITPFQLLNCGIGEKKEVLTLHIPKGRHSLSSFAYEPKKGGDIDTINAEILPLNDVILEHQIENSLVKIDTEGFEYFVFCGLTKNTLNKIRFILFELAASNLFQAGSSPSKIFSLPFIHKFDVYLVKDDDEGYIESVENLDWLKDSNLNVNVLLVKKDPESQKAFKKTAINIRHLSQSANE